LNVKIMSMHRVVNYGSFMQAFALKRVVEGMGHQVRFADFAPGEPRHHGVKVKTSTWKDKLQRLPALISNPARSLNGRRFRRDLHEAFVRGAWPVLGLRDEPDYDTASDMVIVGSDEVFNYTQNHAFGYVPQLFGHGIAAPRLISYAASAGYANADDVERDQMAEDLRSGFAKFDALSVRDQNTMELVSRYAPAAPELVIDPTLIYDFAAETGVQHRLDDCLLVYAYEGRLDHPDDVAKVRAFARSKGLRVVSIGFYHAWCDENLVVEPLQLLSIFATANCILTDTFHGTIFSIKNRKPFLTLLRKESRWGSNFNKVSFLLDQMGLTHRISRGLDHLNAQMGEPIDYAAVDRQLLPLRERSLAFLSRNLEQA